MSDNIISILGTDIPVSESKISISDLSYNKDNPRVYSVLYGENSKIDQNQDIQQEIYKEMLNQPSVKNIKQDIQDYGGLLEPILIRHDTLEVIEGNSRLTVYKFLNNNNPHNEKWQTIPCRVVCKLTAEQQDAYLNYIHIKGKTDWSAYEKANFIYRRFDDGISISDLAKRFSETENEIKKRIDTIAMMIDNEDNRLSNYSYYDVLRRTKVIHDGMQDKPELKKTLLSEIKEKTKTFTAMHLRDKLPAILDNKKHTKKFIKDRNLDDTYKVAKKSNPDAKLRFAITKMKDVTKNEITRLEKTDIKKLIYTLKKIKKEHDRINDMIKEWE